MTNEMLQALLRTIEECLTHDRDPGDTHDYSSAGYYPFDDGYIRGVEDTIEAVGQALGAEFPPECGFCHGKPVQNAEAWTDGKPHPPAACPRCGKTNLPEAA